MSSLHHPIFPRRISECALRGPFSSVLDIGAGTGALSVLCASYGATVDAVDNQSLATFRFPSYLSTHPSIKFFDQSIETFSFTRSYDCVLLSNVVMFLDKSYFFTSLFPVIISHLHDEGSILVSFFGEKDRLYSRVPHQYSVEDFSTPHIKIFSHEERSYRDIEEHHLHFLHLTKI